MEKLIIIDLLYHVYYAVVIGKTEDDRLTVEITKKDYSKRKDRPIKTIDLIDVSYIAEKRINILFLDVLL